MSKWYVRLADKELGPISNSDMVSYRDAGRLTRDTPVHAGDGKWTKASRIKGLFATEPDLSIPKNICPFCKAELADGAIKCRHCGEFTDGRVSAPAQQTIVVQSAPQPKWNPGIAAVLSFIIPGLGQMYKGDVVGGIVWLCMVFFAYAIGLGSGMPIFLAPGVVMHLCCVGFATAGDPQEQPKNVEPK